MFICLARRKPIVISGNRCRKTVQETLTFCCKLLHAFGENNKPRVRLQASTEQPPSELGEQEACRASSGWGSVPDPALAPFRLLLSISPKCIAAQCQPCCSCVCSALRLCPRRSVGDVQPRNPGLPARAFGPAQPRSSWMRRAGSSELLAAQGGDSGALRCSESAWPEAFGGVNAAQGYGFVA